MRVCLSCGVDIVTLSSALFRQGGGVDLVATGYGSSPKIDYVAELTGAANNSAGMARLSKGHSCVLVAGIETSLYGERRKSAAIFEDGRLLNISDMVDTLGTDYSAGTEYNVYRTKIGRLGVIIGSDLHARPAELLHRTGSGIIVCTADAPYTSGLECLLKGEAKGRCPIVCVCRDFSVAIGTDGAVLFEGARTILFDI